MTTRFRGFTLVQTAVGVAVVSAATGIILPAVAKAREAAARATCADNLRKVGGALHAYESKHGKYPPRGINAAEIGWGTMLLPYAGHEDVYRKYRHDFPWRHPENRAAVTSRIAIYQCPLAVTDRESSDGNGDAKWTASCSDYAANGGILPAVIGPYYPKGTPRDGVFMPNVALRVSDVTDGVSTTAAFFEVAGRPTRWNVGKNTGEPVPGGAVKGPWAHTQNHIESRGHDPKTGTLAPGTCAVNCSNFDGVYAFHPNGANAVFCDGSVRFLSSGMNVMTLHAISTFAMGEIVAESDF